MSDDLNSQPVSNYFQQLLTTVNNCPLDTKSLNILRASRYRSNRSNDNAESAGVVNLKIILGLRYSLSALKIYNLCDVNYRFLVLAVNIGMQPKLDILR